MTDVFLSYKSEDRDLVATLAHALEREGISVWWDKKIAAGGTWRETIASALSQAKVVIVAWSKRTEQSADAAWVFNEVDEAQRMKLPLIPVQLEACDIPLGYRHVQAANLAGWRGDANNPEWREVLDGVRAAIAGKAIGGATQARRAASAPRAVEREPKRGGAGWLIALAAIAVLAGGGYFAWRQFAPPSQTQAATSAEGQADASSTTPASEAAPVLGESINVVHFGANGAELGTFRREAGGVWGEYNADGVLTFAYTQSAQGADGIELDGLRRNVHLFLNLSRSEVWFSENRGGYSTIYNILSVDRGAEPGAGPGPARIVHFTDGQRELGTYRREGDGVWGEYGVDGQRRFSFQASAETEVGGVVLYDATRDVWVTIDLPGATVWLHVGAEPAHRQFQISLAEL